MKKIIIALLVLIPSVAFSQKRVAPTWLYGDSSVMATKARVMKSVDSIAGINSYVNIVKRTGFDSLSYLNNSTGVLNIKAIAVTLPTGGTVTPTVTDTTLSLALTGVVTLTGTENLTNKSVNGVTLTTGGSSSEYLNGAGTYSTPSGGGGSALSYNSEIQAYRAMGSQYKAQPVGCTIQTIPSGATNALADNQARYVAVWLDSATTLTGVALYQSVAGVYTADQTNQVGLYTYSGGTMTRVASSTNNGNLWKSSGLIKEPFSSTYAAAAGLYFVGMVYNQSAQTTAPVMFVCPYPNNTTAMTLDFSNSAKTHGTVSTQNSLPSTQASSGTTANNNKVWVALY